MNVKKPIVLCILDGFGSYQDYQGNALTNANTPTLDMLFQKYPWININAAEEWVGLPSGQMGNSEVGHLNIGTGRIVYQPLVKISQAIIDKTIYTNKAFQNAINHVKKYQSNVHVFGLLSDGGVHSHINHFKEIMEVVKASGLNPYAHVFMDGRDTAPAIGYKFIKAMGNYDILTISGRYYAMDRDKNFNRLVKTTKVMIERVGATFTNPLEYLINSYNDNLSDEFIVPAFNKTINVKISDNDAIIMINFRPDRANQIIAAFTSKNYYFKPNNKPQNIYCASTTQLANYTNTDVAFPLEVLQNSLGDWLANNNFSQLRIAETEKYAHVTFFFDGGVDKEIKNSKRILLKSPSVATYDLQPEMALPEITSVLQKSILSQTYDVIILNYANPDMVGHTGNLQATITAVEAVDGALKIIYETLKTVNGTLIITADHGNAEEMLDETGGMKKTHTINLVPFLVTNLAVELVADKKGALCGVAPAIIKLLNQKVPVEMSGESLIIKINTDDVL